MNDRTTPGCPVLTLGEALVALLPTEPVCLEEAPALRPHVGGAEINFAVWLARMSIPVYWLGAVGEDAMGRLVLSTLRREQIDAVVDVDHGRPTGLYLRGWAQGREREVIYYRRGSAASALSAGMWPTHLSPEPGWVHLTGITAALGEGPRGLLERALDWAEAAGVPVSFDPNYRPTLWDEREARAVLSAISSRGDYTLLSEDDAQLMCGTTDPEAAFEACDRIGIRGAVLKRGEQGVWFKDGTSVVHFPAVPARVVRDTVGAGDAFDAGFVAGRILGEDIGTSISRGIRLGARAVEAAGEHSHPIRPEIERGSAPA
jgi:2-dehydro-3-deoxygluconokinase